MAKKGTTTTKDENLGEQTSKNTNKSGKKTTKIVAIVVTLLIVLGVGAGVIIAILNSQKTDKKETEQEYSTLKQVDVNGLTISEACEKVRAEGWTVEEVAGNNDYSEKSDCSDTTRKVVKAYYNDEKYYSWGEKRSDYETVGLRFQNEKKADNSSNTTNSNSSSNNNSSTSNPSNNSTNSSSSSSKPSSSSSSSSSSNYQSIYNTYADRLRKECPNLSITECAEISNEGVEKMAEYMWKASGTDGQYETYSEWAGKLYDVYMEAAR